LKRGGGRSGFQPAVFGGRIHSSIAVDCYRLLPIAVEAFKSTASTAATVSRQAEADNVGLRKCDIAVKTAAPQERHWPPSEPVS